MEELETLIVQTNDTNDKLDELITVNESSLVQQKEIADSISELNPTLEAILVKIAEDKHEKKDDKEEMKKEKHKENHNKMMKELVEAIKEIKIEQPNEITIKGIENLKGPKGDTGEPGNDGYTPIKGKDYFDGEKGEKGNDGSPDTAEQIAEKLNTTKRVLDWKVLRNVPELFTRGGNGIGYLREISDVELTNLANNDTIKWSSTLNKWVNGTGGGGGTWGSITGTLSAQTDLQSALNAKQDALGFTPENVANKATDFSTVNDTLYPTVQATKTYADNLVAGLLDYRGAYDASSNLFPSTGGSGTAGAIMKGDMFIISVAGTLGGTAVQIGDSLISSVDTPGQTASNWNILEANISYVPEDVANKTDTMAGNTTSSTKYLSSKGVYDWATATLSGYVAKTGDETVAGLKTFTSSLYTYTSSTIAVRLGKSPTNSDSGMWFGANAVTPSDSNVTLVQGSNYTILNSAISGSKLYFGINNTYYANLSTTGLYIGTGLTTASYALDVSGSARVSSRYYIGASADVYLERNSSGIGIVSQSGGSIDLVAQGATGVRLHSATNYGTVYGSFPNISSTNQSLAFNADYVGSYRAVGTSAVVIERNAGKFIISADTGLAGGYNTFTPTNRFTVDGSTGHVGVGTTSPNARLHVNVGGSGVLLGTMSDVPWGAIGFQTTALNSGTYAMFGGSGLPTVVNAPSGQTLQLASNGTPKLYVGANGVGIGVTTPLYPFHYVSASVGAFFDNSNSTSSPSAFFVGGNDHNVRISSSTGSANYYNISRSDADGLLYFRGTQSGFTGYYFKNHDGTKYFTLSTAGRFGINVASPSSTLHLAAGSATANSAPLQFNSGAVETVARPGVMEFTTDDFYLTGTTGNTRKTIRDLSYRAITALRTLDGSDELINCTANSFTVTLPTAVGFTKQYTIKNTGTGIITIATTSSQTIDGVASGVLTLVQWDSIILRSDGANWIRVM